MDAEATVARTSRLKALLAAILRNTWLSILGLAIAVVGDALAGLSERAPLLVLAGGVASAFGFVKSYRPEGLGCLGGAVSLVIRLWSVFVPLILTMALQ